jgi:hypothetical protein
MKLETEIWKFEMGNCAVGITSGETGINSRGTKYLNIHFYSQYYRDSLLLTVLVAYY